MINYFLGIISGQILNVMILGLFIYFRQPIERTVNQVYSKMSRKGSIIEPEEEVEDWLADLKKEQ